MQRRRRQHRTGHASRLWRISAGATSMRASRSAAFLLLQVSSSALASSLAGCARRAACPVTVDSRRVAPFAQDFGQREREARLRRLSGGNSGRRSVRSFAASRNVPQLSAEDLETANFIQQNIRDAIARLVMSAEISLFA